MVSFLYLCFTDINPNAQNKLLFGWVIIFLVIFLIIGIIQVIIPCIFPSHLVLIDEVIGIIV